MSSFFFYNLHRSFLIRTWTTLDLENVCMQIIYLIWKYKTFRHFFLLYFVLLTFSCISVYKLLREKSKGFDQFLHTKTLQFIVHKNSTNFETIILSYYCKNFFIKICNCFKIKSFSKHEGAKDLCFILVFMVLRLSRWESLHQSIAG